MSRKVLLLLIWCAFAWNAQPLLAQPKPGGIDNTGRFWIMWGYNRSEYSTSDIHFTGPGYDFTLFDVEASDDPEEFDAKVYVNPLKLTIPQFNFRMGYQLTPRWQISLGWDHMKWVLTNGSTARITGNISEEASSFYAGEYDNEEIILRNSLVRMEHTDGLNYLRFNFDRSDPIWQHHNGNHAVYLQTGIGAGPVIPWTDSRIFGVRHRTVLHIAGIGVSASAGIRALIQKRYFAQASWMVGHVNLTDVTTTLGSDRATQSFNFLEWHFTAGAYLNLMRIFKKDCKTCPKFED